MRPARWRVWPAALGLAAACVAAPTPSTPAPAPLPPPDYPQTPPPLGPAPELRLPPIAERRLPNGLRVLYVRMPELPLVHLTWVGRGGLADAPEGRVDVPALVADLLDEGAGGRSAEALAVALESLGAQLRIVAGWDGVQLDLEAPSAALDSALVLARDVLFRPDFRPPDVERLRRARLAELAAARDEPRTLATQAFAASVFGDHPYGRLPSRAVVERLTRDELVRFHRLFYRPAGATLIVAGDVAVDALHPRVAEVFGSVAGAPPPPALPTPAPPAPRLLLLDKPGAPQAEIRVGLPAAARADPDLPALRVLNTLLGGSFTSRLNQNLREAHGYTYGASSSFGLRRVPGPFTITTAVVTAKADSALLEIRRELVRIRDEAVPPAELERAKRYLALGLPRTLETPAQVAGAVAELALYDRPLDELERFVPAVLAVTAADVQRVAQRLLRPDGMVVVVVGDRAVLEERLRALGWLPVVVGRVEAFAP